MSGLEIDGLRVVRGERTVLEVPSLAFPNNTVTAILGPNGSGKTSLLRAVAGLDRPAGGYVTIDGEAVVPRLHVALAMQEAVFLRGTVRSNLALGLGLRGVEAAQCASRLAAIAAECRIEELLDRSPRKLSVGEAQRVNLARALVLEAPVILLDEPLAAVDRAGRRQLMDELPGLLRRRQAAVLVVTHDREEALELADRLVLLAGGRVLASGGKRELMTTPPNREAAEQLGFTVVRLHEQLVTVPPGGFRISVNGEGEPAQVISIVDLGREIRVNARLNDQVVNCRAAGGSEAPRVGDQVWVEFPGATELGKETG